MRRISGEQRYVRPRLTKKGKRINSISADSNTVRFCHDRHRYRSAIGVSGSVAVYIYEIIMRRWCDRTIR